MLTLTAPKQSSGRRAQARGDVGEDFVEAEHSGPAFQRAEPGAWFVRRYPRKVIGARGVRYAAPQGPDFGGGVHRNGVAVACEVEVKVCEPSMLKSGKAGSARLAFERFTEAEVKYLTACRRAGGLAVVLVLVGRHVTVASWHAVPWAAIERDVLTWSSMAGRERVELGIRAGVVQEELNAWRIERREMYLRADWLR